MTYNVPMGNNLPELIKMIDEIGTTLSEKKMQGILAYLLVNFTKKRARKKINIDLPSYSAELLQGTVIFRALASEKRVRTSPNIGEITDFLEELIELEPEMEEYEKVRHIKESEDYKTIKKIHKTIKDILNLRSLNSVVRRELMKEEFITYKNDLGEMPIYGVNAKVCGKNIIVLSQKDGNITMRPQGEYVLEYESEKDSKAFYQVYHQHTSHSYETDRDIHMEVNRVDMTIEGTNLTVDLNREKENMSRFMEKEGEKMIKRMKRDIFNELLILKPQDRPEIEELMAMNFSSDEAKERAERLFGRIKEELAAKVNSIASYEIYLNLVTTEDT